MILFVALSPFTHVGIPHTGGGDPVDGVTMRDITMYSPRKRGFFIVSDRQNGLILLYSKQEIKLKNIQKIF
mgnify:FL=1